MREAIEQLAGRRVLVVGDVILDRTVAGTVDRISPEAPVPVVSAAEPTHGLGGAANVAAGVRALGSTPLLVGVTGADDERELLAELAAASGISTEFLRAVDGRPTTLKTRIVAGEQQIIRIDREVRDDVDAALMLESVGTAFESGVDALVLSDYAKGVLSEEVVVGVLAEARRRGIPAVVDPKHGDAGRYTGATIATPNLAEFRAWCRSTGDVDDLEAVGASAASMADANGIGSIVVTVGGDGLVVGGADGSTHRVPGHRIAVFDVTGAGDTVTAALGVGAAAGLALTVSAEIANLAGSIAVSRRGTAIVGLDDLRDASTAVGTAPLLSSDHVADRVAAWRREGLRIVFTNGCFDLLHRGHLAVLQAASGAGDIVIVGLNSDASVRRLKGDARPLSPEADRVAMLAELRSVDAIVVFDDDDPGTLVELIRPDVIVKGGDYRVEDVVGGAAVIADGGRVLIVPTVGGYSTTSFVADIGR